MTYKISVIVLLVAILATSALAWYLGEKEFGFNSGPQCLISKTNSSNTTYDFVATSSVILIADVPAGADYAVLKLNATASSTISRLDWEIGYSDDRSYWFGEDTSTTTKDFITAQPSSAIGSSEHSQSTTTHRWTIGAISQEYSKNIIIPTYGSNYVRVKFTRGTDDEGGNNSNHKIWAQIKACSK
jgi:hypothetical protein